MSSAGTCPCHLDWSTDIHGARREPVNNEKAWLIFAVRLLSRTVVGKVNGQETVWSQSFKPSWWDQEVGLAWKNPTTNPKDTKQVLMKKFEALQKHLKNEGKFPEVLEGEARLWNAGKFSDLFFMTSVLGVLEKTIDLHSAVTQLCARKGSRIFPDLTLVGSIKKCLAATLLKLDQIGTSDSGVNSRTFSKLDQLETSDCGVNSRTFSKLGQLGTSYNTVLEKPDSIVLETSNSGISKTSCSDVSLTSNIAVNGSTFSKLNQLRTSNSGVLETSGTDILKTSNIAVNDRMFLKLGQLKTSFNAVLETPESDVNSRTFPKLVQLETSYHVVKGKTFSKLGQLGTSYAVLVTSDSAVNGRTLSKLGQLGTSDSAVNGRTLSKLGHLGTSDSAVNGRTFPKLGQLGTSDSAVNGRTFPKLGQLGTSDSAVKCRAPKRRSSQSSGSYSDVSANKTQKVDSPAVKNPLVGKSEFIARNGLRLC